MPLTQRIRDWARQVKRDSVTLWFASRHPQTPLLPKALCVFTVAYALSPIDLIPDFIPVLGYLDEVFLLPAFIWLAVRLVPADVLQACRQQADEWMRTQGSKPRSYVGAVVIVLLWLVFAALIGHWYFIR